MNHAAAQPLPQFEMEDHLNREWDNELVTYPVPDSLYGRADVTLVNAAGEQQAHQWATDEAGKKSVAFLADVPKFGKGTYSLRQGAPVKTTDLKLEEDADVIRLVNSQTGIAIRKKLAEGQAPIARVRLNSGNWVGASQLKSALKVQDYSATVTARGPVYAEVLCETKFSSGQIWRLRFRLNANEPVVVVSEAYELDAESFWTLDLTDNFSADKLLYRIGNAGPDRKGAPGTVKSWNISEEEPPAFVLEPWLRWSVRDRQGNWFGVYPENGSDFLTLGALNAGQWVDPQKNNRWNITVPVEFKDGKLNAKFSLQGGSRRWMLAALDKSKSTVILGSAKEEDLHVAPLPQQYLIKYGDFPLDMVKDYVLDWKSDPAGHPRLLATSKDVERWKKDFKPDEKVLADYMKLAITIFNVEGPLRYYLATGDEKLGRRLAEFVLNGIQGHVDTLTQQKWKITLNYAPHHMGALQTHINVADGIWSTALTDAERATLKAQMAFIGYTVNRADYWSPERGYAANPNMTTMVAGYQALAGMMLKSHPLSKSWGERGLTELKSELKEWSDAAGGWLEAPTYAVVSYDYLLGLFLEAHNAGLDDSIYDPKMKQVGEWLAQISTPPDSRAGGIRHLPIIGNTWINQPCGEFGILAYLWKDKDPAFSARMQWMHKQHGEHPDAGSGGFSPSLEGYRELLMDASLPAKKPDYKSTLFPETGVMLRNGVDDRETQLHMIAGSNHAHYDADSGSITLWGKGRIVADDFGYYGLAPLEDASLLDSPLIGGYYDSMHTREFHSDANFDYVHGIRNGWHRRVAMVKDSDMLAPNYFVLRDTQEVPAPGTWRLWLSSDNVQLKPNGAFAEGREDVDTDIVFLQPQNIPLTTEVKAKTSPGNDAQRRWVGKVTITQTGLIAKVEREDNIAAVIFPRLKTQAPPKITTLVGGKAVKVEHQAGTDYVFLGDVPFKFDEGDIHFEGISGLVKIRGGKAHLSLGAAGKLTARGQKIEKKEDPSQRKTVSRNLVPNGDFENGQPPEFYSRAVKVALYSGNPVPGDTAPGGKHVMALTLEEPAARWQSIGINKKFYVNRDMTYRFGMKVYSPSKVHLTVGGSAFADTVALKNDKGTPWSAGVSLAGPSTGWQKLEATIGPPGSGAKYIWPEGTLYMTVAMWLVGTEKGTMYVDDIVLEPVAQ